MAFRWEEQREYFRDARRARYLARIVGKTADVIIAMSLWHIPGAAGAFAALFYLLMCDGFPGGRSAGKWLTGLKVVRIDREPMDLQSSLLRNLTVASPFLLYLVPVVGPFLAYTVGLAVLLIETYLGFYDSDGQRAGDTFAETVVVEFQQAADDVSLSDCRPPPPLPHLLRPSAALGAGRHADQRRAGDRKDPPEDPPGGEARSDRSRLRLPRAHAPARALPRVQGEPAQGSRGTPGPGPRGERYHRHPGPGGRGEGGGGRHHLLGQGPLPAGVAEGSHPGRPEGENGGGGGGPRNLRRGARPGSGTAGPGGRPLRQRPRRPGHRRKDRIRPDPGVRDGGKPSGTYRDPQGKTEGEYRKKRGDGETLPPADGDRPKRSPPVGDRRPCAPGDPPGEGRRALPAARVPQASRGSGPETGGAAVCRSREGPFAGSRTCGEGRGSLRRDGGRGPSPGGRRRLGEDGGGDRRRGPRSRGLVPPGPRRSGFHPPGRRRRGDGLSVRRKDLPETVRRLRPPREGVVAVRPAGRRLSSRPGRGDADPFQAARPVPSPARGNRGGGGGACGSGGGDRRAGGDPRGETRGGIAFGDLPEGRHAAAAGPVPDGGGGDPDRSRHLRRTVGGAGRGDAGDRNEGGGDRGAGVQYQLPQAALLSPVRETRAAP